MIGIFHLIGNFKTLDDDKRVMLETMLAQYNLKPKGTNLSNFFFFAYIIIN